MKTDTHPEFNNVCFEDLNIGERFLTKSTMTSDKKDTIDGEEFYIVSCSITSDSHPFYTGEKRLVDTAGRIFQANHTAAKLLAYDEQHMPGLQISRLFPEDQRIGLKQALL